MEISVFILTLTIAAALILVLLVVRRDDGTRRLLENNRHAEAVYFQQQIYGPRSVNIRAVHDLHITAPDQETLDRVVCAVAAHPQIYGLPDMLHPAQLTSASHLQISPPQAWDPFENQVPLRQREHSYALRDYD